MKKLIDAFVYDSFQNSRNVENNVTKKNLHYANFSIWTFQINETVFL